MLSRFNGERDGRGKGPGVSQSLLRQVLWADAACAAGTAGSHLAWSGLWAEWLGLPVMLILVSGGAIAVFMALAAFLASRTRIPFLGLEVLILGNGLWALGSLVLVLSGWLDPTMWGVIYLVVHVVIAGVMAMLEWLGARRLHEEKIASETQTGVKHGAFQGLAAGQKT